MVSGIPLVLDLKTRVCRILMSMWSLGPRSQVYDGLMIDILHDVTYQTKTKMVVQYALGDA